MSLVSRQWIAWGKSWILQAAKRKMLVENIMVFHWRKLCVARGTVFRMLCNASVTSYRTMVNHFSLLAFKWSILAYFLSLSCLYIYGVLKFPVLPIARQTLISRSFECAINVWLNWNWNFVHPNFCKQIEHLLSRHQQLKIYCCSYN